MESLTLSLVGGVFGVLAALWGVQLIAAMKPANMPSLEHIALDGRVLGFAFLLSLLTGVFSDWFQRCKPREPISQKR